MDSSSPADIQALVTRLAQLEAENRALRARADMSGDLAALLHSIDGILWVADPVTFAFSFVSNQAERILGFPPRAFLDDPNFWPSRLHPDDRAAALDYCVRSTRAGLDHEFDYRMIAADGRVVWIHDRVKLVMEGGKAVRFYGVMFDITERKLAEGRLALDAQILALVHDSVVVTDLGGTITYWNAGAERLFGGTAEERVGRDVHESYPPPDRAAARERFARVAAGAEFAGEYEARRLDDSAVWVDARVRRFDGPDGRPAGLIGISHDVSDRKRARDALREREEWFRALVEDAFDSVSVIDAEGRAVYASPNTGRLFGRGPEQVVGRSAFQFLHPDDLAWAREELARIVARPDHIFHHRVRMLHEDGRWVWVETRARNLLAHPVVRGIVVNMIDVTERVRVEEEHKRLAAMLLQAQKMESLGVLAGGIAHDFNNLLTSMLGYATLARDVLPGGSPAGPMLEEVERAARRAAELTGQLLAYAGKGRFVVRPVRLSALVREMARLLQTVVSKRAAVRLELADDLPLFEGDPAQLQQVVMNLITNASDALDDRDGEVRVRTGVETLGDADLRTPHAAPDARPGPFVFLEVADTGVGMDADTLARIFDPFFTTKFTGRGLGLAAVLGIVRGHRGLLRVESTPGAGSRFRVYFPVSADAALEAPAHPTPPPWRGRGAVLVIDDEEGVRSLVATILARAGLEPVLAANGTEGLELFRRRAPDLVAVLVDLTMPGPGGLEVAAEIHRLRRGMPVVLMSGYGEQDVAAGRPGVRAFLPKPFRPDDLLRTLAEAVGA